MNRITVNIIGHGDQLGRDLLDGLPEVAGVILTQSRNHLTGERFITVTYSAELGEQVVADAVKKIAGVDTWSVRSVAA